ncbi:putative c2h2 transcription factor protein [Eutypa lata UCREL1]|uniref:Putative c2h2 transcription factor protein n=1 Tax=Eutypa lata (strain UCR-EL1) TaxID=1287681 RepID=M7STS3_EUTLA|nr:putative c2h2 transcription factor protein [Eutypa lata UCREL1]
MLMRAVQLNDNDTDEKKPVVDDHTENYYPSPPHLDHTTSIEVNIKFNSQDETDADKPHVCKVKLCGRRFTQKTHLDTHKRTHTGEKPYIHERRHLGEKPFACAVCQKRFPQKANLRTHEETHTGIKRFSCRLDTCAKKFGQLGNLKIHMNKFHAAALVAWQEKFQVKPKDELTPAELEMRKYFATMFQNSNKGIKGRGKGRHVKTIEEMASNGNINVPSHPPIQQHAVPMHPPLHHPPVTHIGAFPPHYGIPRNDPGHGGMHGRNTHGTYDIYDMGHGSSMDGSHPSSHPAGTMLEEDRHRGLGFQDRFHERLY